MHRNRNADQELDAEDGRNDRRQSLDPAGASIARIDTPTEILVEEGSSAEEDSARSARVARIRTAIAEGSYHVGAADLAEKLIEHMLSR